AGRHRFTAGTVRTGHARGRYVHPFHSGGGSGAWSTGLCPGCEIAARRFGGRALSAKKRSFPRISYPVFLWFEVSARLTHVRAAGWFRSQAPFGQPADDRGAIPRSRL